MLMIINDWRDFARITVETGDLDPMYVLIDGGRKKYGYDWAAKYALHFFMFYDAGQSAAMANSMTELDFWHMEEFGYSGFKRGTERRHFRGEKGLEAVHRFQSMGSPIQIWERMYKPTYASLVRNIEENFQGCQIGPYFAWKAMDLLDRCLNMGVELTLGEAAKFMPDEPRKCAQTLWPNKTIAEVLAMVQYVIADLDAPGTSGKKCGYSEAETVLCMLKGFFITKTHTIGDDVEEKYNQLKDHTYLWPLLPKRRFWGDYERGSLDTKSLSA